MVCGNAQPDQKRLRLVGEWTHHSTLSGEATEYPRDQCDGLAVFERGQQAGRTVEFFVRLQFPQRSSQTTFLVFVRNPNACHDTGMSLINVRRAEDRGSANLGWLQSRHTFSFGEYHDPDQMGFRSLRVINEDRVAPGGGFPTHPHRDMEIFSYVVGGALAHRDSMGNVRTLRPGEIQLMSAGSGVTHSEYNPSPGDRLHFLQIWIQPAQHSLPPSYTEWRAPSDRRADSKSLVISPDGQDGAAIIHQDAKVFRLKLEADQSSDHALKEGRGIWLQMISGHAQFDGIDLEAGDGASTEESGIHIISAQSSCEALLFDLN